jgi:hypothetical protein
LCGSVPYCHLTTLSSFRATFKKEIRLRYSASHKNHGISNPPHFSPEDGSSMFIWNHGIQPQCTRRYSPENNHVCVIRFCSVTVTVQVFFSGYFHDSSKTQLSYPTPCYGGRSRLEAWHTTVILFTQKNPCRGK